MALYFRERGEKKYTFSGSQASLLVLIKMINSIKFVCSAAELELSHKLEASRW
jgi:hypothetical protein